MAINLADLVLINSNGIELFWDYDTTDDVVDVLYNGDPQNNVPGYWGAAFDKLRTRDFIRAICGDGNVLIRVDTVTGGTSAPYDAVFVSAFAHVVSF